MHSSDVSYSTDPFVLRVYASIFSSMQFSINECVDFGRLLSYTVEVVKMKLRQWRGKQGGYLQGNK